MKLVLLITIALLSAWVSHAEVKLAWKIITDDCFCWKESQLEAMRDTLLDCSEHNGNDILDLPDLEGNFAGGPNEDLEGFSDEMADEWWEIKNGPTGDDFCEDYTGGAPPTPAPSRRLEGEKEERELTTFDQDVRKLCWCMLRMPRWGPLWCYGLLWFRSSSTT